MSKYVAIVMKRHYLTEDTFIFTPSHATTGVLDEETKFFIDKHGNQYPQMLDTYALRSEIPYAYSKPIKIEDLKAEFPEMTLGEAISFHEYDSKSEVDLVGILSGNQPFICPIPLDRIRQQTQAAFERIKAGETVDDAIKDANQEINQAQEETVDEQLRRENGLNSSAPRFTGEMNPDIAQLIMDVVNGEFSLSSLKKMLANIESEHGDIESLIETVKLQIDAIESGEKPDKEMTEEEKKQEEVEQEEYFPEEEEQKPEPEVTEEEFKPKKKDKIDLAKLLSAVTKTLIAQDEPTRRVITEIARKEQSSEAKSRGILLTGATGVGKTKMMKLIAKHLDRPFFKIDATQLTIPGYVGTDIEEELWRLFVECGGDLDKAEHAIVFIDEIDKKGSEKKDDVSGKGVLNILLPFIEGTEYNAVDSMKAPTKKIRMKTNDMIVILGGAYTDVYKNLIEKNGLGFGADVKSEKEKKPRKATPSDFIQKSQMTDEFMGRVAIVHLNDLSVDDLIRVITDSDESSLLIQQKLFEDLGVKLTAGDDFMRKIAQNAFDRKTGARGLNTVVEEATWEAYYDAYMNGDDYEEIILTADTVDNPKQYTKVRKQKGNN